MLLAAVTVGGAIVALEATEIVYGAIGLAASLFGVATLFFLLNAPYVAAFQVTVYIGAVAVLILFTVMLVRQEKWAKEVAPASWTKVIGALSGVAVAGTIIFAALSSDLAGDTTIQNTANYLQIGQLISTEYSPILEVLALVLAASVIGALTLSRADREKPEE